MNNLRGQIRQTLAGRGRTKEIVVRTCIGILVFSVASYSFAFEVIQGGPAPQDAPHDELRTLRNKLFKAYEKRDVEQLLKHVHHNAVITWQNAETSRGRQGLREFYKKMMEGDNRIVESLKSELTVDELSILHGGDTAVAFGSVDDEYHLTDGRDFNLTSRWTATVVKEEGQWVVASFHLSANVFDNPILDMAASYLIYVGIIAGMVGLLLGVVAAKLFSKRRNPAA